jgi:hypothetical protein
MADIGNTEINKIEPRTNGSYIRAVLNPQPAQFNEELKKSSRSILEIGCGVEPRISWRLGSGDIWVGCDPAIGHTDSSSILVHKGEMQVNPKSKLVVFSDEVADIPRFKPDIFSAVAPNQQDITEGKIFNDDLTEFLDPNPKRKQYFFIVLDSRLDNRTFEVGGYQKEAIKEIREWMAENDFEDAKDNETNDPELDEITDKFKPSSNDLGGHVVRLFFVRHSEK